jgi:photosystem II stability/assembly factor-like uncharacterized protein
MKLLSIYLKAKILTKNYIMMKRLLLLFVGLMAIGYLQSQTGWIEANSNLALGNGVGQISVGMLDETALWALPVDATGAIVDGFTKSLDGGQTWFPGTFNAGDGLSQLFAFNATTCWAVFNTGPTQGIYKTANGGTTWVKKGTAYGASSFANLIHFFNEDDGVAQGDPLGGYYEIYTTINGGETWTRVPSANIPAPTSGEYGITGNYDAVGDHIWFGTNKGRVFHSSDKGLHWTAALTNFGAAEVVQPEFADELNGICFRSYLDIGLETAIGETHDGGATWTTVNVSGPMYARYFAYVPGTEATYVGSSGEAGANGISYSTDGGHTWAAITEGYSFLASVWLDNETGWAGSFTTATRTFGGMYIYDGPPLEPFAVPTISLGSDHIYAQAEIGTMVSQDLTVTNTGGADLEYQVSVIYDMPVQKAGAVSIEGQASQVRSLGYNEASVDPDARPASYNPPQTDDFVLHYDGDNASAIGWNSVPVSPMVAAMFPTNLTLPHAGMMLSSVDIYINDPGTNYILKIWDMGTSSTPGEVLVSQPFTGQSLTWNSITLTNPVYITGADIWVGYQFTQNVAETFVPGTDGGPANPNGDFVSTGISWTHLSDNPELDYNWNIRANLTGIPMVQWLSVSPASGTITPGGNDILSVTCDANGLEVGTYTANLRFISNDPSNGQVDLPVTFEVLEGGSVQTVGLDFEAQEDWSLTFDPWTVVDVDGSGTYGFETVEFTHNYEPMAFIAFNPATTIPPMTDDAEIQPHSGVRFGACMASADPTYLNDDWLISPQIALGMNSNITLWVKSYTPQYGLERYNILVSTTDNEPESFTSISGPSYMEAPEVWTEVSYDLSEFDGQTVYVAIQCVTADAFIFMVDDISISFTVGTPEQAQEIEFAVYPNPVTDHMNIVSGVEMTQVDIFNQLGQKVFSQVIKDTNFNLNTSAFNSGVYYIRITTGNGIATEKVMVR